MRAEICSVLGKMTRLRHDSRVWMRFLFNPASRHPKSTWCGYASPWHYHVSVQTLRTERSLLACLRAWMPTCLCLTTTLTQSARVGRFSAILFFRDRVIHPEGEWPVGVTTCVRRVRRVSGSLALLSCDDRRRPQRAHAKGQKRRPHKKAMPQRVERTQWPETV